MTKQTGACQNIKKYNDVDSCSIHIIALLILKQTDRLYNSLTFAHTFSFHRTLLDNTPIDSDATIAILEEVYKKGGRSTGTTLKRKRTISLAAVAAKNVITSRYKMVMSTYNKHTEKNLFSTIISEVKLRNNIPADLEIKPSTISQRIIRNSIVPGKRFPGGLTYHFNGVEIPCLC